MAAYGSSPDWTMTCRVRELLPAFGRLCAEHVNQVVSAVGAKWNNHPGRWLACALLATHVDLVYVNRMLRIRCDHPPLQIGQATTRVFLPEAFDPDQIAPLTRQIYAWRDEPNRSVSSGRREPLQVGLLVLQIKELVLDLLVPPIFTAVQLHAWLTAGHLAQSSDLRASLVLRYLYYANLLVDDYSVPYCPRWKQGSTQFFRLLKAVQHKGHLSLVPHLLNRMRRLFGHAILRRLHERIHGNANDGTLADPTLQRYVHVFSLTFGLSDLSFEDTEGLACELKDALLHQRGARHRHHRSEMHSSFDLSQMPVGVSYGPLRAHVCVDMRPAAMIGDVADPLIAQANYDAAHASLTAELQRLVCLSSVTDS